MDASTIVYSPLDRLTEAALTSPRFAARLLSDGSPPIAVRFEGDAVVF